MAEPAVWGPGGRFPGVTHSLTSHTCGSFVLLTVPLLGLYWVKYEDSLPWSG